MRRVKRNAQHVAELDGLRAVAVLPVIAYHFGANVNGPAGVTVFFALSGFIVTTVLVREHESSGSVRLGSFYMRRFRRLLPASTLVVVATVVVGWVLAKPSIVRESVAALTYWADIERFTGSYSYGASGYAPLEHFWSLAVEEQFYVVLPVVCLLLLRFGRSKFAVVVGVAAMASVWFAVAGSSNPLMYFHPLARVCELLVGVLLALSSLRLHRFWGFAGLAALGVVLAGLVHPLPVVTALVTCAVIAGLPRVLAWAPLVFVGQYSYGLYLWHPLAAVVASSWLVRVALAVVFAVVCLHLVEAPVRFVLSQARARVVMGLMSVGALVVVVLPFGAVAATFVPVAPVVKAVVVAPEGPVVVKQSTVKRPLRVSAVGDSSQMFMDGAWEAFAAANSQDLVWVEPPTDLAVWTSGADSWIRDTAPGLKLSLPHDGPQGGIDRQGCPLVYELMMRPLEIWPLFKSETMHSATPVSTCDWHLWVPQALAAMRLDVLVASWGPTSMWEYQLPDGHISFVGNPDFDAVMVAHMHDFEVMAAAFGTSVLWVSYSPKMPVVQPARWSFPESGDALASLLLQRECSSDLRLVVRADPEFGWYQDGYHFTAAGAARAVASIAPDVQRCGVR